MIIDQRVQRRTIKIDLKQIGYFTDIDEFLERYIDDLTIITEQRKYPDGLEIKLTIK